MLLHGEKIVDTMGDEIDRLETKLSVRDEINVKVKSYSNDLFLIKILVEISESSLH